MPIIKSAKKALRQDKKRRARNLAKINRYKTAIKKTKKSSSKKEALKLYREAQKALDKAAKAGTIKRNKAARLKSRLMKKVNKL